MTDYLDLADFLLLMERTIGAGVGNVGDFGLLESALARPKATVFGEDAYPDLPTKAAALLASICGNHALIDGNKRMGWISARAFCALNGTDVHAPHDDAFALVMAIASGDLTDVDVVARRLSAWFA